MIPDIGLWEFLLFSIVAIVLINPDDWPKVLRKVGNVYGQVHEYMLQARSYTQRTYHDIIQEAPADPPYDPGFSEKKADAKDSEITDAKGENIAAKNDEQAEG